MTGFRSIAPLTRSYHDDVGALLQGFDLGAGVTIGPHKPEHSLIDFVKDNSGYDAKVKFHASSLALVADDDVKDGHALEIWDQQSRRLHLANLALWIAKPTDLGFELAVHGEVGPRGFEPRTVSTFWPIYALRSYQAEHLAGKDLAQAQRVFAGLANAPKKSTVRSAIVMLSDGLADGQPAIRFMLIWVALEALFGPEDRHRIGKRIARGAGAFLASAEEGADMISERASKNWEARCAVVHGLRVEGLPEDSEGLVHDAEEIARGALLKIALSPEHLATFSGPGRDRFLRQIAPDPRRANILDRFWSRPAIAKSRRRQ